MIAAVLYVLAGAYLLFTAWLCLLWRRAVRGQRQAPSPPLSVTVLVAARNEAANLPALLADLQAQDYRLSEFILVDDHSTDGTADIARHLSIPNLTVLSLPDGLAGKKAALAFGLAHATGDVIATTDADCRLGSTWLTQLVAPFSDAQVQFAFGPVTFHNGGLWQQVMATEFASLVGSGAALLHGGMPTMCNGANLAYRRRLPQAVGGYSSAYASGDDTSLLMAAARKFGNHSLRFVPGALVTTAAPVTPQAFYHQRIRWASKWKGYGSPAVSALAAGIFLTNLAFVALALGALLGWVPARAALLLWLLRLAVESLFLWPVIRFLERKVTVVAFLLTFLGYPFYAVFFGAMASIRGKYHWKGRETR